MATTNASGAPVTLAGTQLICTAQILLEKIGEHVDEFREAYRSTATDIAEAGDHGWFTDYLEEITVMQKRFAALCRAHQNGDNQATPVEWLVGDR